MNILPHYKEYMYMCNTTCKFASEKGHPVLFMWLVTVTDVYMTDKHESYNVKANDSRMPHTTVINNNQANDSQISHSTAKTTTN